jgi:enoyl-CoA hydratase/carnithine racemase
LAGDDRVKVVLRGEGGIFSTGADMANAYSWYGEQGGAGSGPAARVSAGSDSSIGRPSTLSRAHGYPKATVAEVRGWAAASNC